MSLNDPRADQTSARKPRFRVLLTPAGGRPASPHGAFEASITSNNWYQCDTCNISLALVPGSPYDIGWWSQQTDVQADVQLGFLPPGQPEGAVSWTSVIQCGVDEIEIDPIQGTVHLEGRDLAYLLIESKTTEEFNNRTSSEVVTILAQRHGLTPVVTATTTPVARYYEIDHTKSQLGTFHREQTEWDLCVFLAQREHFDLFVTGKELHFQPKTPPDTNPYVISFEQGGSAGQRRSNVESLKMSRSLILAKDIQVDVSSWDSKAKRGFTVTARKTGTKHASAVAYGGKRPSAQRYAYIFPNLTHDQAQKKAEELLSQLTQHERVITFDQPGILGLTPRTMLRLQGTNSDWNQVYYVDSIVRTISFDGGFGQKVRAKNMDTSSQVIVY